MDVSRWLAEQGLGHHSEAFAKNGIAGDILRDLTDADLKELGLNLGDRKRLLKAIAALAAGSPDAQAETTEPTVTLVAPREPERRQLTVMFVDLVGSTELAVRLDPEDMRDVIRVYHEICAEVIAQFEGRVAKYMGDGVLAYFGWPQAHEDDAERAVRSGLATVAAISRLAVSDGTLLAARVGIATGLVVVGDLVGEGAAQEQAVTGDTPNLAARLQALAAPGTVLIAGSTRRLLGGLFALSDLGPVRLKGFAKPLAAFRVEGEGAAEGRFMALRGDRLTPLIGRDRELAMLLERWAWAKDGRGQVVLIVGEPGIGKSRLLRALRDELNDEPHLALSHFCSPHHTNSALHPVIAQLERAAGFASDTPPETRLGLLEALLGQSTPRRDEAVSLLAALLGIPPGDRYPPSHLSLQRQKQRTLEVLLEQLEGLARDRPVLALYEDLHWVDPSTLEFLDLLVERVRALRVLAVLTFRPEFTPPWTDQSHVTTLPLNRLGRRQGAAIIARITGGKTLPGEVLEQIVARTDGVPLFVEELTKTVLESGLLTDTGDRYELSGPLPPFAIPATLHDSLMARLDRLAPVKEVAQIGAVIGREFSRELLAAISPLPEDRLDAALDQLVSSELIFRRGTPPEATYAFKHALIQDAAYQSLLKSRRQVLHSRIATVLEDRFSEVVTATPEVVAHHWTVAGQGEPAVRYWLQAGRRATERSAESEAVAHLSRGLEALSLLPEGVDRKVAELDLQIAMGTRLMSLRGWAAPEVVRTWERARELCDRTGDAERLATVLWGQCVVQYLSSDLITAVKTSQELLQWAEGRGHLRESVIAHRTLGHVLTHLAEFDQARWHLEQTAAIGAGAGAETFAGHAYEPVITSRTYLARCLLHCGYPDQCSALLDRALAEAERLAHLPTIAFVLFQIVELGYESWQPEITRITLKRLVPLAREQGYAQWLAMAVALDGWVKAIDGEYAAGWEQIRQGTEGWERSGNLLMRPFLLSVLADACIRAGRGQEALRPVEDGLGFIAAKGEVLWEPELHRLAGDAWLLLPSGQTAAEACYIRAIEVARGQGARLAELRAATTLARLWAERGGRAKAYDLLAPVYSWFTEGFNTVDFKHAQALLDELET